jgi:hypothetical protein
MAKRTQGAPGGPLLETDNVSAGFSKEELDDTLTDDGDRVQPLELVLERAQPLGDLLTQLIDQFVRAVTVGERKREEKRWSAPTFRRRRSKLAIHSQSRNCAYGLALA